MSQQTDAPGNDLPANVLLLVFSHLSLAELCTAAQVSRYWHCVASSERLWAAILQQQFGCSSAPPTGARQTLLRLRTTNLWGSGVFRAETTTLVACPDSFGHSTGLSVGGTELAELWCAQQQRGRRQDVRQPHFAVSALAAGRSHLVLPGSHGQVVDTRGVFVQPSRPQESHRALLLVSLLHQDSTQQQEQQQEQQQQARGGPDQAVGATSAAGRLQQLLARDRPPNISVRNPWLPPGGAAITSIAAGDGHVLAVAADGRLWGWGSNDYGQLGLGSCQPAWQATPTDCTAALDGAWKPDAERVALAACGTAHSVVLMASGAVYTAGCNREGQCGQDLALRECPVFCAPRMAPIPDAFLSAAAAVSTSPKSSPSAAAAAATAAPAPSEADNDAPLPAVAAMAAGPSNTVLATRSGRVLVCGSCSAGQCGVHWLREVVCPGCVDVGPDVSWHGLTRPSAAEVEAAGGSVADALAKVVQVAAGDSTCYALTDAGEVFAWGQGSKGQLGTGGCPKVQSTPARLPWARQVRHISASPTGQFAAAVDSGGKLYTWGAGKWGQLGHGDTSKRTVGRLVKQLRHLDVLQVQCCAESLMVLTAQHIPHMQQQRVQAQEQQHDQQQGGATTTANAPAQLKSKQGRGSKKATTAGTSAADTTSSPTGKAASEGRHSRKHKQQQRPAAAAAAAPPAAEQVEHSAGDMSMTAVSWQDVEGEGPFYCPAPAAASSPSSRHRHSSPAEEPDQISRRSRGANSRAFRRTGSSSSSGANTGADDGSSPRGGDSGSSGSGSRHPRMDKGFKRLLKRLLTGFMADSSQREMTFPDTLSAADRYHVHVAAEAYGLAHASHNQQGPDGSRVIKVWKVSRSR